MGGESLLAVEESDGGDGENQKATHRYAQEGTEGVARPLDCRGGPPANCVGRRSTATAREVIGGLGCPAPKALWALIDCTGRGPPSARAARQAKQSKAPPGRLPVGARRPFVGKADDRGELVRTVPGPAVA